jgi:hypothetical protein
MRSGERGEGGCMGVGAEFG